MLTVLDAANDDAGPGITARALSSGADLTGGRSDDGRFQKGGYNRLRGSDGHWASSSPPSTLPKPAIAAVNGVVAGAGLSLALAADSSLRRRLAAFHLVRRGLTPTGTTFHPPPSAIPALEMMFTGDPIDAATAERWGLVNRVVEPDAPMPSVLSWPDVSPRASITVELRNASWDLTHGDVDRQLQNEAWAIGIQTEDKAEGGKAFRERREPRWTGR
jgi:enoyl-CoA hydratase/carnithine racemase